MSTLTEPVCDRCGCFLVIHGDTLIGQGCDLDLACSDLWRDILKGIMGERRGTRIWWELYRR